MNEKKTIGVDHTVGTCLKMCPDKEASFHEIDELSAFETDPSTGKFSKDLAITTFHRSEANKKFKPEELRPLPVLQKTMKHILHYIIGQRLNTSAKTTEIDLYMYLRDRFRAICTDITVQFLEGKEIIEMYQTMILFFIWAGARFPNAYDTDKFDTIMNLQTLTNMLSSLENQYDEYFKKTGVRHPCEPDFRSFYLLKYVSDDAGQFMAQLLFIPPDLFETEPIQNVFKLRQAVISRNLPDFIQILESTSIQFAIMAVQCVPSFYFNVFLAMKKAMARYKINQDFFTIFLDLPKEFFQMFATNFSIVNDPRNPNNNLYSFDINGKPQRKAPPALPMPLSVKQRFERSPLLEFLILKPSSTKIITLPPKVELKNEIKTEDNTKTETNITSNEINKEDQVAAQSSKKISSSSNEYEYEEEDQYESSNEEQNESEKSSHISSQPSKTFPSSEQADTNQIVLKPPPSNPFLFKKIEPSVKQEEIADVKVKAEPYERRKTPSPPITSIQQTSNENNEVRRLNSHPINIKMTKIVAKPQLFNFPSMIPSSLPPNCFISVVVNDSDGSPSADFARNCLNSFKLIDSPVNKKNYIIYLSNTKVSTSKGRKSHVYISIVRKKLQKYMNSVGAILNCEDTATFEEEEGIPVFTFSLANSKSNPELILNGLMRKCIEAAVVEFRPMDLTEIVKASLSASLRIALSPEWQRASCNAIFELFNHINEALANVFESELFMRYLLPFIHNQFGPNNMKEFAASIRKMKFSLIDKEESTKPQQDSTWPIFIRDNMKISSITPFIAPVSVDFNPQDFLKLVICPYEDSLPSEYVQPSKEDVPYADVLHAFDCDLYE